MESLFRSWGFFSFGPQMLNLELLYKPQFIAVLLHNKFLQNLVAGNNKHLSHSFFGQAVGGA